MFDRMQRDGDEIEAFSLEEANPPDCLLRQVPIRFLKRAELADGPAAERFLTRCRARIKEELDRFSPTELEEARARTELTKAAIAALRAQL